ncbi:glycosyltransferase 61 family protein [Xanthobacter sp. V7C-4]|uniref:glycosyltransferase 61 family protein n=1 Tax=Xanthobacter autotrophicus (strain ATCC BAA-1158 / Py2) TaxID=78245 RepID=UPI00372B0134
MSARIEFIHKGIVAPLTRLVPAAPPRFGEFDGGVYYADGGICSAGIHGKTHYENRPKPITGVGHLELIEGEHIFGGMLQEHFGHFLTESIGRSWALNRVCKKIDSIIFYHRVPGGSIPRFANELLNLIRPSVSIKLIQIPSVVELLAVPSHIEKNGVLYGHPEMRLVTQPLRNIIGRTIRKVYVSRSGLRANEGGFLFESEIDRRMESEGFEVIHPERMSLTEQFEIYNSAEYIVFAEGSALHLYAMVARPDQKIFIIWRRKVASHFLWQIMSFGGPSRIIGTPCIAYLLVPPTGEVHAKAVLDFRELGRQLYEEGFIKSQSWAQPRPEEVESEISEISKAANVKYDLRQPLPPVGSGSKR